MFQFEQIAFYLICVVGTLLFSLPVYGLIVGEQKTSLHSVFLFGSATMVMFLYWASRAGISMRIMAIVLSIVSVLLWIVAIAKKRMIASFFKNKMPLLLLAVCIAAGMLALIPTVVYKASFPYGDGYTYIAIADYLLEHGYGEKVVLSEYMPWLTQTYLYQVQGLRMGAQMLLSFWTALCGQEYSIFLYAAISGLGVMLFGCAVWKFVEFRFENKRSTLFAVIFAAFNIPIIVWSAIFGLLPQLYGCVFLVAAFSNMTLFMEGAKGSEKKSTYAETGMYIAAMALCYSEIVPFFVLMVVALYLVRSIRNKVWISALKRLVLVAVISFVVMGDYTLDMIHAILLQFGAVVGYAQSINWLGYVGYWLSSVPVGFDFKNLGFSGLQRIVYMVTTLGMLVILVVGYLRNKKQDKSELLKECMIVSVPFLVMLAYFTSFAVNPFGAGIGNSWSVYKLAQYYFPVIACYLFPFFASSFDGRKLVSKVLSIILLVGFIVLAVINTLTYSYNVTRLMYEFVGETENPIEEYVELADRYQDEERTINLIDAPEYQRKLLTYFLRDNKLTSNWSSDEYFSCYGPNMDPAYDVTGITLKYAPKDPASVAGMVPVDAAYVRVIGSSGVGVTETQADMGSWTWNDPTAEYTIANFTECSSVAVSFDISCAASAPNASIEVFWNDQLMLSESVTNAERRRVELSVDLGNGEQGTLRILYHGDTVPPSANDERALSVAVWNLNAYALK